ncbi:MAG: MarR family transcriptional regulator, partial [Oscillospiraceae bacterium]|nr:MarR family transcriptional regulator [Oscillospiraceae bacterium]
SGLVRRVPSKEDRRSGCVVITEKGRVLQKQARERFDEIASMELNGFTEEEREQFAAYLCRVYRNLTGRETE